MTMTFKNIDAIKRAIEWATKNPDKITAGSLAETAGGTTVHTLDPRAECFCLAGRIAHEAGVNTNSTSVAMHSFVEDYLDVEHEADALWEANDDGVYQKDPLRGFEMLQSLLS